MKRIIILTAILLSCILLAGCWNYRGMDELDIVTGIAVDKDEASGKYKITYEIVDTQAAGGDNSKIKAKYVESEGETLFDAIRNSKRRLINKLYGGNMQTMIISKQIAEKEGVNVILEELLRDAEPRETMSVVISQEESAQEILLTKGIDSPIISYEIHEMIEEDSKITASTVNMSLYRAYNAIKGQGKSLVLPVIRCIQNEGEAVLEGNGIALFKNDHLHGFLSAEQTKFYLFIVDEIKGGALSFPVSKADDSVSMEIKGTKTQTQVSYVNGKIFVKVSVKIKLNIMEIKSQINISQAQQRKELEHLTEKFLEEKITELFKQVQSQNKIDIFGLGSMLYRKNPDLWRSLEDHWDELFQNAHIQVDVKANIMAAGVLKNY